MRFPKPDYHDRKRNIRLYRRDCLELLPRLKDASIDCVVTSPPYNTLGNRIPKKPTGKHANNGWMKKVREIGYAEDWNETVYQHWLAHVVAECLRATNGLVWINHKVRYREGCAVHPVRFLPFPIYSEVTLKRPGSMALNCKRYAPSHEVLLAFGQRAWWDDAYNTRLSVWDMHRAPVDGHPCPFHVDVAEYPIRSSCRPGGIVLDPFLGSGTTAIAAINAGRGFIGCEKEAEYFELAVTRLQNQKVA